MEFIVVGAPRSANAGPRSRRRWRERVTQAARARLMEQADLPDRNISVVIIYFYQGETTIDVDNIAKSVLDGLKAYCSATIDRSPSSWFERPDLLAGYR